MTWQPNKLTNEQKEARRLEGAQLLKEGRLTKTEIAQYLGVSRTSVHQWAKKLRTGGIRRLKQRKSSGRSAKLTRRQKRLTLPHKIGPLRMRVRRPILRSRRKSHETQEIQRRANYHHTQRSQAGIKVADLLRKHGISEGTFYRWKAKYGGMELSEAKRLKQLEEENRQLKRLVAEQALDIQMLKDVTSKNW